MNEEEFKGIKKNLSIFDQFVSIEKMKRIETRSR